MLTDYCQKEQKGFLQETTVEILRHLDKKGLKPTDHLEGKARLELNRWNQRHPTKAIKTFCDAFLAEDIDDLDLRRSVGRRLFRAKGKVSRSSAFYRPDKNL